MNPIYELQAARGEYNRLVRLISVSERESKTYKLISSSTKREVGHINNELYVKPFKGPMLTKDAVLEDIGEVQSVSFTPKLGYIITFK